MELWGGVWGVMDCVVTLRGAAGKLAGENGRWEALSFGEGGRPDLRMVATLQG